MGDLIHRRHSEQEVHKTEPVMRSGIFCGADMLALLSRTPPRPRAAAPGLVSVLLSLCVAAAAWPHGSDCPSSRWSVMCRPCCEYQLIQCRCPSRGSKVGYTVPCCRNAVAECDPCIIHPGCSLFENCKSCNNGTWKSNDDFFVNGKYCTECRRGWSGGDCKTCGGVIQRAQGHIALETYPTNGRCEWTLQVEPGRRLQLSFSLLSLESDHSCRYDYVEVRDGDGLSSPVIGRFCGDRLPPPLRSSGNFLHILFASDGYNNFDGFALTFQESSVSSVKNSPCPPLEAPLSGSLEPVYGPEEELVSARYRCSPPFTLTGSRQRVCLPNGTWSGTAPRCVEAGEAGETRRVRCSPAPKLPNGASRPAPGAAAGTRDFFCKKSYVLSGNQRSSCSSDGSWSAATPKCVRACREPKVSELVRREVVTATSRLDVPDLMSAGFLPLSLEKQEQEVLPPGFHPVYTSLAFTCASRLYRRHGSSRRTCLKTGRWSGRHATCSPVCGKSTTVSRHNLTATQWPWHAAIFIRSPPGGGATEESWVLACSGALLSRRGVLVAARCVADQDALQPLHADQLKVVVGAPKKRHHLRVSDVLVHPDADVAVLRLEDKARISEGVAPACLPPLQGGEVTARQAYAARWVLPNGPGPPSRPAPSHAAPVSHTALVELADVLRCERALARPIGDHSLCVIRKSPGPHSSCPGVVPGVTVVPAASAPSGVLLDHRGTLGASSTTWLLLGLERSCSQETHTLQTRISSFRDWIEKITQSF